MLSKIYRCWTVYGNSWRVVCLPMIFWFGTLTCAILNVYYDYLTSVATDDSRIEWGLVRGLDALTAFYSANIATNLYSTCKITLFLGL